MRNEKNALWELCVNFLAKSLCRKFAVAKYRYCKHYTDFERCTAIEDKVNQMELGGDYYG